MPKQVKVSIGVGKLKETIAVSFLCTIQWTSEWKVFNHGAF